MHLATPLLPWALASMAVAQRQPSLRVERELFLRTPGGVGLAWSPDGGVLAVAGGSGTVRLLDVASGSARCELDVGRHIGAMRFSPDGLRLAVGGTDVSVWAWSAAGGARCVARWPCWATALDWSDDGSRLAFVGAQEVRIVHGYTLQWLKVVRRESPDGAYSLAFRHDGRRLALSPRRGVVQVCDLHDGSERAAADLTAGSDVGWLRDGRLVDPQTLVGRELPPRTRLAIERGRGRWAVQVGDAVEIGGPGQPRLQVLLPQPCHGLALHPDGERWASTGPLGVDLWRRDRHQARLVAGARVEPQTVVLSRCGGLVVIADPRWTAVFDAGTGRERTPAGMPAGWVPVHLADRDGIALLCRLDPRGRAIVHLWDEDGGGALAPGERRVLGEWCAGPRPFAAARLRGRWLSVDGKAFDLEARRPVPPCPDRRPAFAMPDGGALVVSDAPHGVQRIDARGRALATWAAIRTVRDVDLSPDGSRLAVASAEGAQILTVAALRPQALHDRSCFAVRWIDDRHLLVARRLRPGRGAVGAVSVALERIAAEDATVQASLTVEREVKQIEVAVGRGRAVLRLTDRVMVVAVDP